MNGGVAVEREGEAVSAIRRFRELVEALGDVRLSLARAADQLFGCSLAEQGKPATPVGETSVFHALQNQADSIWAEIAWLREIADRFQRELPEARG